MLFHWQSSNEKVSVDMHGNVISAFDDDFMSYWTGDQETQAAGTFTAPFSGLHGWYWENKSDRSVNIVLHNRRILSGLRGSLDTYLI